MFRDPRTTDINLILLRNTFNRSLVQNKRISLFPFFYSVTGIPLKDKLNLRSHLLLLRRSSVVEIRFGKTGLSFRILSFERDIAPEGQCRSLRMG